MGMAVLILGYSGSGKSASMRNFKEDELSLVNVNGKALPFKGKFKSTLRSDNYSEIEKFIKAQNNKIVVIDDSQYLMANEFMRRAKETSYQKFTDIGRNFWTLVKSVEALPEDVFVYFMNHIESDENGRQKAKTIGKLLDEKITVEGMFTVVLKTVTVDGKYLFATQTDGSDTVKTPMGLFDKKYIENDLKLVDETLRGYYGFCDTHICSCCGKEITTDGKRTVEEIINGSMKFFGSKMCMNCVIKKNQEANSNAVKTVSE